MRAGSTAGAQRECQVANRVFFAAFAAASSGAISLTVAPGGFSSITCLPASSAIRAWVLRTCGGVQSVTASIGGSVLEQFFKARKARDIRRSRFGIGDCHQLDVGARGNRRHVPRGRDLAKTCDGETKFCHVLSLSPMPRGSLSSRGVAGSSSVGSTGLAPCRFMPLKITAVMAAAAEP